MQNMETSSIFAMIQREGKNEIIFCGKGLHFGKVEVNTTENFVLQMQESYLTDYKVLRAVEINSNQLAVCLSENENIHIFDRKLKKTVRQISNHSGCTGFWEIVKLPGFNYLTYPFLLVMDQYALKLLNVTVNNESCVLIKDIT